MTRREMMEQIMVKDWMVKRDIQSDSLFFKSTHVTNGLAYMLIHRLWNATEGYTICQFKKKGGRKWFIAGEGYHSPVEKCLEIMKEEEFDNSTIDFFLQESK